MNESITERAPLVIAVEIIRIKQHTCKSCLPMPSRSVSAEGGQGPALPWRMEKMAGWGQFFEEYGDKLFGCRR